MRTRKLPIAALITASLLCAGRKTIQPKRNEPQFQTSDRCLACHNGLVTAAGADVSIGLHWRASMMGNSSRDPYWQGSVRREVIDHPESQAHIEDECPICHMPITRYEARLRGKENEIFAHLPVSADDPEQRQAADGVSCSVCHQITREKFGTRESFNGGFVVHGPAADGNRTEYGPFEIKKSRITIMRSSAEGYHPEEGNHICESELCATCRTLITTALGASGKSDWRPSRTDALSGVGPQRLFMLTMLSRYREDLNVSALPPELIANAQATVEFLQGEAAIVAIETVAAESGRLRADVVIRNKSGHKLPTAYPSRRVWLHFVVRDRDGRNVFESGALNPDGSIVGNDNDADPARFEPHYTEIRRGDQVEIYESIIGDESGHVTTGLLTGVRYLKDTRLLPDGFDKQTADMDVAIIGDAFNGPGFTGGVHRIRYSAPLGAAAGPFTVEAELRYQPIGRRWANNLKLYNRADQPRRFNAYFDSMHSSTAALLARSTVKTEPRSR